MAVHFARFSLDASTRELRSDQTLIHLTPKAFQLLVILVEQRPRAVPKSELLESLWPATFVTETNLANLVGEVRAALQEDSRNPQFIRTVYGFGYAFRAEVHDDAVPPPHIAATVPAESKRPLGRFSLSLILLCAAALSLKSSHVELGPTPHRVGSIAILPFKVISPIPSDEILGAGLADVITTRLSNVREMTVRPTSAVARSTGQNQDPVRAGEQLRVEAVLSGTVRRAGDRIRVSVQLFTIDDGRAVWGRTYDEKFTETFKVEDAVAANITSALTLKLTRQEQRLLSKRYTENSTAYGLYMSGRRHLQNRSSDSWNKSVALFQAAIHEDPDYAIAYAGLADAYAVGAIFKESAPGPLWQKSAASAEKAVSLDDELSEGHSALGMALMAQKERRRAEQEFRRSLELNPSNGFAHREYAMLLQSAGRFDEAIDHRERAVELDPLSLSVIRELGWTYYLARRYDESISQQRLALAVDSTYIPALLGLGQALVADGKPRQAEGFYRKAMAQNENHIPTWIWLARTEAVLGRPEEARRLLTEVEKRAHTRTVAPFHLAVVYTALGEKGKALTLLEQDPDNGGTSTLAVEPAFDELRSEPRFKAIVERMNLAQR